EWAAVFLFFLLLAVTVVGEIVWLKRRGWAAAGKAAGFVLLTDILSMIVGSVVAGAAFFGMFMMVMGPSGQGGNSPEWAYWIVLAIAVIVPAFFLFLTKRAGLAVFSIKSGSAAWSYSLVSTLLIMFLVLVPPPVLFYLASTFSTWKR
ncbi:MAG: hypothetical protein JO053_14105, partial [Acidobacteria bacterium]|nr:hypothetical protein [Acidobacteriota bacterium]